ncbi:MAG TPA: alpha/beta fold hydrolase [Terriglobales bacterium]|nr:alpha/beta fold hydrolase [Terriglobales bacterium]
MPNATARYEFEGFELDVPERRLLRGGSEVDLAPKVFDTLRLLVENAGHLMTKEDLLRQLWPDAVVEENNLNRNISVLRKLLGQSAGFDSYIETVPRAGYRFVAKVTELNSLPVGTVGPAVPRIPSPSRQEIRFCTTQDAVRIAYARVGSGYPLMKAANWLNHLDFEWESPLWQHWINELTQHHTFIRYDERGNGLSDWDVADISFDAWVHDLETVVEAAGVERFDLFGLSQGGAVAIAYAARHPERVNHLILCGAYSRGFNHRQQTESLAARHALETLVRLDWGKNNPAFSAMFTGFYISENASSDHQQWLSDLQRVSATPENAARIMEACDAINVRHLLPKLSVPTIVFHCDRDRAVPPEEGRIIAAEIPNAKFVPLPSPNHLLLAEEPAWRIFLQELGEFLGWKDPGVDVDLSSQTLAG